MVRPEAPDAALLLGVVDGLPGMVGYWDRDLRNVLANQAYVEYFGFTPETMRGLHIREILGERVYALNEPYMRAALAGEEQTFDRTLIDQHGRTRYVQATYSPQYDGDDVEGFLVLVTDVTERVVAEREVERIAEQYRALARSIPRGFVLLYDEGLRFLVAEGPELGAFGFSSQTLEGRSVREAFPAELADRLEPRYLDALAGRSVSWEREINGRTFSITAGPVPQGVEHGAVGMVVAHDITGERQQQAIWAALHETARSVAKNVPPDSVARRLVNRLTALYPVDAAAVVRFVDSGPPDVLAIVSSSLPSDPRALDFLGADAADWAGGISAPIRSNGQTWGAICLRPVTGTRLDDTVREQLASFAELLEISLSNLNAWSTLNDAAGQDALTGLPNRRTFTEQLGHELDRPRRGRHPFSVVLIDIDHFKRVNDEHGHAVGDQTLVELATRLRSVVRDSELLARLGGEEFVWLLPHTGSRRALVAAERARRAVADQPFPGVGAISISLGVCGSDALSKGLEGIVDCADQALYDAKRAGRNRSAVYRAP